MYKGKISCGRDFDKCQQAQSPKELRQHQNRRAVRSLPLHCCVVSNQVGLRGMLSQQRHRRATDTRQRYDRVGAVPLSYLCTACDTGNKSNISQHTAISQHTELSQRLGAMPLAVVKRQRLLFETRRHHVLCFCNSQHTIDAETGRYDGRVARSDDWRT